MFLSHHVLYSLSLGSFLDFPCPNCLVPHPDCSMCMAYKRTYGASFLRHRFSAEVDRTDGKSSSPSPSVLRRKTPKSKAKIPQARARIPITLPISSDEDEDRYRAALTVSSERRNRPRMFGTPVKETTTSPSRGVNGNGSYVRSTVKDLLKKNDSVLVCFFYPRIKLLTNILNLEQRFFTLLLFIPFAI